MVLVWCVGGLSIMGWICLVNGWFGWCWGGYVW